MIFLEKNSFISCVKHRWNSCLSATPPPLGNEYTQSEYVDFMKAEISRYSPSYTKARVTVKGEEKLLSAMEQSNVIIGMLHHGSWILIGGVIRHVLNLPYTVVASRRNFDVMSENDKQYWEYAHRLINTHYQSQCFYSDQAPFRVIRWLNKQPAALGVVFDVREYNQSYNESKIAFDDRQLYVQTGPAKLARMTNVTIVPAAIHYDQAQRKHELEFFDALSPVKFSSDVALTQAVFSALEPNYTTYERQRFYDMTELFSAPHIPNNTVIT
ncbi:MAG: hypothetical protein U9R29_00275 [Thermodesulfobacteriota bacterium]|nr:hypothetical protein [Thermodesulfobacteriota bacterium]